MLFNSLIGGLGEGRDPLLFRFVDATENVAPLRILADPQNSSSGSLEQWASDDRMGGKHECVTCDLNYRITGEEGQGDEVIEHFENSCKWVSNQG